MNTKLPRDQQAFAISILRNCVHSRGKQASVALDSGLGQGTVSKILSGNGEPSVETLEKLFDALGLKLSNVLADCKPENESIHGYLATPLTGLTNQQDEELRSVVASLKQIARDARDGDRPFELYWPGDHTHPKNHPEISAKNVYLTDRSRASTYDFVLLFCALPSFGVGQENEIAAQACTPAIRLVPNKGLSRMMLGSFLNATDVPYEGSLDNKISFDVQSLAEALKIVRGAYFKQKALAQRVDMSGFGDRLKELIAVRYNNKESEFAGAVGISKYFLEKLEDEPFAVINPSAQLLGRLANSLDVKVSYLLGEDDDCDSIWVESNNSWRAWIRETEGLDANRVLEIRDDWRREYRENRRIESVSTASHRKKRVSMAAKDWDKRYQARQNVGAKSTSGEFEF